MADEKKYVFLNRDLSWLSFNYRVLMEAADPSVPLFSRINFLSIFSSNLDEFFRVRMPSILMFSSMEAKKTNIQEEYPRELVESVQAMVLQHQAEFGKILKEHILPELRQNGIHLCYDEAPERDHSEYMRDHFLSQALAFLQPVFLLKENKGNIFLVSNALYFLVDLETEDEKSKQRYAILNIPTPHLPRFIEIPRQDQQRHLVFLDDIIRENIQEVFQGYLVKGVYSIKLTRNAELFLEDEFTGDISEKIEKQLEKRDAGNATRLLFDSRMPENAKDFIQDYFGLHREEFIEGSRYHNLKDLADLPGTLKDRSLSQEPWPPMVPSGFHNDHSIFYSIEQGEKLLHLPFHSYNYILRFFNEAAIDPTVKEIYISLYRVATNSLIVNALISAARNGKKVTVFVELKARFDEENNLKWSKKMKAAGIRIINSIPRLKVHGKIALVKRQVNKEWKNYCFLGTGNFNEATGRFYTDHALLTSHEEFCRDLENLFEYLQTRKQPHEFSKSTFNHLLVSQFNLTKRFEKLIDNEIRNAREGKPSGIIIKMNNLQEKDMVMKLYEASNAGVKVQLILRSICTLAPAVEGQSEHITVRRIVDRYLEHGRLYKFMNGGEPLYYAGSADWMNRNLHSRIEVVFPLYDKTLCDQVERILELQLSDTKKAVMFNTAYENLKIVPQPGQPALASQESIYEFVKTISEPVQPLI